MPEPSLNDLRDIVMPEAPSWWPLAPGLGFLLILVLWVALCCAFAFFRSYQSAAYRRAGIALLASAGSVREVSILLKRVALVSFDRETVASLYGKQWVKFLQESCAGVQLGDLELPTDSKVSQRLRKQAKKWMRGHKQC